MNFTTTDLFWIIIGIFVFILNSSISKWGWHLKKGYKSEVAVGMLRGSLMYYLGMVIISISFIYYSSLNFEVSLGWIIASIFWGRFKAKKELIEIDTKLIMEEKNISYKAAKIEAIILFKSRKKRL